ncbi:MAG: GerW family sporulation protein [Lachnospiraceae bacterium]|nr:GerW family sporulation protein [Lachnospiraceae bacterium]
MGEVNNNNDKKSTNNVSVIVNSLLEGMDALLASKTVVGEPTKIGDTIILPLVDVSFGAGAGASLGHDDKGSNKGCGGGGLTGKMSPNAVLVIKNGNVKLVNVKNQDTLTKILDMVPDVIDRFTNKGESDVSDEDAVNAAFPENEKED